MTEQDELRVAEYCASGRYDRAYTVLVDAHSETLLRLVLRMGLTWADAQDAVQEAYINIWKSLPKFRGESKYSTWMYRIAVREALASLRKTKKLQHGTVPVDADLHLPTEDSSEVYFQADEALALLHQAQAQLPEKQRLVFQLRYFDERSYSEIAQITGTSEGGLKANYHHAVHKIRNWIQTVKPHTPIHLLEEDEP